ncbi:MAG TPA: SPOR domain-containing protein [Acidobacteriaceae bacterium]|nr:SPOR domain-containing protein [Acidobacteriaceae bacterium]
MNAGPHDRDDDFMTHEPPELQRVHGQERDREITLSMGVILSIFFALVLVCALFFGMGYTLGRRSSQSQTSADGTAGDSSSFNGFKPSPQSVAAQPVPASAAPATASSGGSTDSSDTSAPEADGDASTPAEAVPPASASSAAPVMPASTKPAAATQPPAPIETTQQSSIVQVAAVSHQEDADVLLSALKKQGYAVYAEPNPQDKLIHIQLGPFANRNDANAMRQRLLADGYNAIVK